MTKILSIDPQLMKKFKNVTSGAAANSGNRDLINSNVMTQGAGHNKQQKQSISGVLQMVAKCDSA